MSFLSPDFCPQPKTWWQRGEHEKRESMKCLRQILLGQGSKPNFAFFGSWNHGYHDAAWNRDDHKICQQCKGANKRFIRKTQIAK